MSQIRPLELGSICIYNLESILGAIKKSYIDYIDFIRQAASLCVNVYSIYTK